MGDGRSREVTGLLGEIKKGHERELEEAMYGKKKAHIWSAFMASIKAGQEKMHTVR